MGLVKTVERQRCAYCGVHFADTTEAGLRPNGVTVREQEDKVCL